ncbi:MAG: hypothetical protein Q9184_004088 [Pyrenodesmia sp. 2 TL-2023]
MDTLCEPIRFDKVLEELPVHLQSDSTIKIVQAGTNVEGPICTAFKDARFKKHNCSTSSVMIESLDQEKADNSTMVPSFNSKLAIVGMPGRFPEADSPEEFWDLVYRGLDVVKEVPPKRWDVKTHVDPTSIKKTAEQPHGDVG